MYRVLTYVAPTWYLGTTTCAAYLLLLPASPSCPAANLSHAHHLASPFSRDPRKLAENWLNSQQRVEN